MSKAASQVMSGFKPKAQYRQPTRTIKKVTTTFARKGGFREEPSDYSECEANKKGNGFLHVLKDKPCLIRKLLRSLGGVLDYRNPLVLPLNFDPRNFARRSAV